jgi:hypothetical protein
MRCLGIVGIINEFVAVLRVPSTRNLSPDLSSLVALRSGVLRLSNKKFYRSVILNFIFLITSIAALAAGNSAEIGEE